MKRRDLPSVSGRTCLKSMGDHELACLALIVDEQERANPNTALIATLCDSVRLTREFVDHQQSSILNGKPEPHASPAGITCTGQARAAACEVCHKPFTGRRPGIIDHGRYRHLTCFAGDENATDE